MARLAAAPDRADAMRWASMLRTVRAGWDDASRAAFWAWLDGANDSAGGFSLRGFIDRIREDAATHVGRPAGAAAGTAAATAPAPPAARTLGAVLHAWTVDEFLVPAPGDDSPRDLVRGARVFREAMCIQCHRAGGDGGANGPDLTGVAGRFTRGDLLRAILEPSAAVSDQWQDSAITLRDGSVVVGRVIGQDAATLTVSTNPLGNERETVARADIERTDPVPTSGMPAGLLDARTRAEVLDLLAYLEAGGRGG
jgi:putative heme-binding domain-containing protein